MSETTEMIAKQIMNGNVNRRTWGEVLFSIKAYGAVGDGVADDSKALKDALQAAKGAPVFFPPGTYDVRSMVPASGKVSLLSLGGAVVKGFKYQDLTIPNIEYAEDVSNDDAFLHVSGVTFESVGAVPGLWIVNQSQPHVIRSFELDSCDFYGPIGLVTENCAHSVLNNCNFIHNQYGWKSLSCTNLVTTACQFISPIHGVYIGTSAADTSGRQGGENLKFQGCTWIDGVTGIYADKHNYLWLSSCLLDYFNCGIYLNGSKFARFENVYIGYNDSNRSGRSDYIAPDQFGALYACGDQTSNRSSGVEAINCEFVAYNQSSKTPVVLDGSTVTFTGVEEVDLNTCRFASDNAANTNPYLLQIVKANEVLHSGNKYYSPSNNNLTAPWVFSSVVGGRIFSERNNFKNCFNSVGTPIIPTSGVVGNQVYEADTITLATNGTSTTNAASYVYKNLYTNTPKVIATVLSGFSGFPSEKLNVGIDAQDATTVFVKVSHIDGTVITTGNNITVNILVIGD